MNELSKKKCPKCGASKDRSEFYKRKDSPDGLRGECKLCHKEYNAQKYIATKEEHSARQRKYYMAHRQERLQYAAKYSQRPIAIEAKRLNNKRYRELYPEKVIAHHAVSNAIRDGRLVRPDVCSKCPNTGRIEGHHEDYSKPLDIEWLCKECHDQRTSEQMLAYVIPKN